MSIQYASLELRNNTKLATLAIKNNGQAYIYISEKLKQDTNLIKLALKRDASVIDYLPYHI